MPTVMLTPIPAPLAEAPRPGSGALLPTLGRLVETVADREVGFAFSPEGCGESGTDPGVPCTAPDSTRDPAANPATVEAWPFRVWTSDECSPWELGRDWRGRARRQLDAVSSFQVARELWTGTEAQAQSAPTPFLASPDSDVVTAGPTSPTDALAVLEYALGQCRHGARGVIHATRHAATYWAQLGLLRREGAQILTYLDSIVVADAGYDGSGPDGQAAVDGSQWAYATSVPVVRLGAERLIPDADDLTAALNRSTNTVTYFAERSAAVAFDPCCHLAAELDLGWADIGGAGS